jgi:alpha-ketoglutarate-dependent taurine dioxygenase
MSAIATTLQVRRLSGVIGAEIHGLDLHSPLDDDTVAAIRAELLRSRVVFFPGAHLTPAEHVAFASNFGELTPGHPVIPGLEEHPEVFEIDYTVTRTLKESYGDVVDTNSRTKANGLDWHTDVTWVARPPLGSILNAIDIPEAGGDTMWSNQAAAFDALSDAMKAFLRGLTALHDGTASFGRFFKKLGGTWEGVPIEKLHTTHPVVRTHPETGEETLFVNKGFTRKIVELTDGESEALLAHLYAHSVRPEFTVRYHWTAGDLAFWDNRATMHSVIGDYGDEHRRIQRITLRGDVPR